MSVVHVTNDYPVSVARLWSVATDMGALAYTMRGLVRYYGLPKGRSHQGMVMRYDVSLFGVLPRRPYRVDVVEQDDRAMRFVTNESGAGLKRWDHVMQAVPIEGGSRLVETIEIEAETPWQTPIFRRFAAHVYRRRHAPRLRLLLDGPDRSDDHVDDAIYLT